MLILTHFRRKIRQLICLLALFWCSFFYLPAQNCPTPRGLSKDSTSITQVHFSWNAVLGARGYKVNYLTPSDTFSLFTSTNQVSLALPFNTDFEIFSVVTICSNGGESDPSAIFDGGIVVTIDDIFRYGQDCNPKDPTSPAEPTYLFFADLCMYTHTQDLCAAIAKVNASWSGPIPNYPNPSNQTDDPWVMAVLEEIASGDYLWEPWDNPDGCASTGSGRLALHTLTALRLAPNPFSESFQVDAHISHAQWISISLFDATGKQISVQRQYVQNGGYHHFGRLGQGLPAGLYYLRLESPTQRISRPVLKN